MLCRCRRSMGSRQITVGPACCRKAYVQQDLVALTVRADVVYMDLWPMADPIVYIFDPEICQQVTVDRQIPKHPGMVDFLLPLAGPGDLVTSNGPHWKKWRSIMNPGFASSYLATLVPGIVDECTIFCQKIAKRADNGGVFRLEEDATRLTVDIIGRVALDLELGTQTGENEIDGHGFPRAGASAPCRRSVKPVEDVVPCRDL